MNQNIRWPPAGIAMLALVAMATAALLLVTSTIGAQVAEEYPERKDEGGAVFAEPDLPRPNESEAQSLEAAREEFLTTRGLETVVTSVEAGEVEPLLTSADNENFCERVFREIPPECTDTDRVNAVYLEGSSSDPYLMPQASVARWIGEIFSLGEMELTFAAKEQGLDRYYLVFKAQVPSLPEGTEFDGLGVVVEPNAELPIRWLRLIIPGNNGIEWLQLRATEVPSAPRFDLVAPETVIEWPGLWGETGEPAGSAY